MQPISQRNLATNALFYLYLNCPFVEALFTVPNSQVWKLMEELMLWYCETFVKYTLVKTT